MIASHIQRVIWAFLALVIIALASQACTPQPGLKRQANAAIADATETDKLNNGCFISRSGNAGSNSRKESVVCPTVNLKE